MKPPPRLQVLVVTMADRLSGIYTDSYPPCNDVEYIFSIQNPDSQAVDIPPSIAGRDDIHTYFFFDRGITRNRNHAIDKATAPYILMADDDLRYTPEALRRVIKEFDARPDADYILWRSGMPETRVYPTDGTALKEWPRNYHPVSFEFSFRRTALAISGIRWNELAGIGAPYLICGEEELMFRDLLDNELTGYFIDHTIANHEGRTTSHRLASSAAFIRSKGTIMRACRGPWPALIRMPLEAWRARPFFVKSLVWLLQGYIYAGKHRESL